MEKKYIVITLEAITKNPITVYRVDADETTDMEELFESFVTNHNSVMMYEETDLKENVKGNELVFPITEEKNHE